MRPRSRLRLEKATLLGGCVALMLAGVPVKSWAQVPAEPQAESEAEAEPTDSIELIKAREQFREALARQAAGNWTEALRLFKEVASVRSTPQVRFNIALCHERLGKLVAALGAYRLAAADAKVEKARDVEREATARAAALAHRIPKLVLRRGRGAETAQIRLDGTSIGDAALGKAIAVIPGPHSVNASADGCLPFRAAVRLAEAETRTFVIDLELVRPRRLPAQDAPAERGSSANVAAYLVGSVGIAALIGSGVSFALAAEEQDRLETSGCDAQTGLCVTSPGHVSREDLQQMVEDRDTYATIGNVGLGVGAAGLAISATLFLLGPSDGRSIALRPAAKNALFGSSLVGRF